VHARVNIIAHRFYNTLTNVSDGMCLDAYPLFRAAH